MKEKVKKIVVISLLVILLILNFSKNFMSIKNEVLGVRYFETFQNDSENLVFSQIFKEKYSNLERKYGLCAIYGSGPYLINEIDYSREDYNIEDYVVEDYVSQFGLQGHIFSFMYNKLHIPFWGLKLICCTLLAIIIVAICYIIYNKYSKLMGVVFYITFLLSPWIVAFARNLYWVEFTWFLPMLLGLILSLNYNKKRIFIPLIFISILVKCLCGYEYISTIMLGTISFFIIDFFNTKDKNEKIRIFKTTLIVGLTCVLAFLVAIVIHANLRGNGNILEGVKSIYDNDVLRRTALTFGVDRYSGIHKESINASILETIDKYFSWNTNIILGIEGQYFKLMFVSNIAILLYNSFKRNKNCYRDLTMFIVFLITTLSWFALGKAHSYIHTHMNYVLWYFGFVQISIYIIIKFICEKVYEIGSKEKGEGNL